MSVQSGGRSRKAITVEDRALVNCGSGRRSDHPPALRRDIVSPRVRSAYPSRLDLCVVFGALITVCGLGACVGAPRMDRSIGVEPLNVDFADPKNQASIMNQPVSRLVVECVESRKIRRSRAFRPQVLGQYYA